MNFWEDWENTAKKSIERQRQNERDERAKRQEKLLEENNSRLRELQKQAEQDRLNDYVNSMTEEQRNAFADGSTNTFFGWWTLLQGLVVAVVAGFRDHTGGIWLVLTVATFVGASLMWHTTRRSGAFLKWSTFVIVTALGITTVFVGWSLGGFGIAALGAFISLGPVGSSFADLRRHRS